MNISQPFKTICTKLTNVVFLPLILASRTMQGGESFKIKSLKLVFQLGILMLIWMGFGCLLGIGVFAILLYENSVIAFLVTLLSSIVLFIFVPISLIQPANLILKSQKGRNITLFILCILIVLYVVTRSVVSLTQVVGRAMEPTIRNEQYVLIKRFNLDPSLNRIVVFFTPDNEYGGVSISRIVAIEGDEILIKDGSMYINGVEESNAFVTGKTKSVDGGKINEGVVYKVPSEKVFVLSDNREHGSDSRLFGFISISAITGTLIEIK